MKKLFSFMLLTLLSIVSVHAEAYLDFKQTNIQPEYTGQLIKVELTDASKAIVKTMANTTRFHIIWYFTSRHTGDNIAYYDDRTEGATSLSFHVRKQDVGAHIRVLCSFMDDKGEMLMMATNNDAVIADYTDPTLILEQDTFVVTDGQEITVNLDSDSRNLINSVSKSGAYGCDFVWMRDSYNDGSRFFYNYASYTPYKAKITADNISDCYFFGFGANFWDYIAELPTEVNFLSERATVYTALNATASKTEYDCYKPETECKVGIKTTTIAPEFEWYLIRSANPNTEIKIDASVAATYGFKDYTTDSLICNPSKLADNDKVFCKVSSPYSKPGAVPASSPQITLDIYDTYDIWVEGVQVTGTNLDDITGDGKWQYIPNSRWLVCYAIGDYNYTGTSELVKIGVNGVRILPVYEAKITTSIAKTIVCSADSLEIYAGWELVGSAHQCVYMSKSGAKLVLKSGQANHDDDINDGMLKISGRNIGVFMTKGHLIFDNVASTLGLASGAPAGAHVFAGVVDVEFRDCGLTSPATLSIVSSTGAPQFNGTEWLNNIVTTKHVHYWTYFCGTEATSGNAMTLWYGGRSDKYASFNSTNTTTKSGTLTISNADMNTPNYVIRMRDALLGHTANRKVGVNFIGTNTFHSELDGIHTDKECDLSIRNTGNSNVSMELNTEGWGVRSGSKDSKLTFSALGTGAFNVKISGHGGINNFNKMTVENGVTLTIVSDGINPCVKDIASFSTGTTTGVVYPRGARFSPVLKTFVDLDGNPIKDSLVICPVTRYGIVVMNDTINNFTKDDVLGDGGSVTYNPSTKVLTLNNATLVDCPASGTSLFDLLVPLAIDEDNATVDVIGQNTISSPLCGVSVTGDNLTIQGSGSLLIDSCQMECPLSGIQDVHRGTDHHTITIKDCEVTINALIPIAFGGSTGYEPNIVVNTNKLILNPMNLTGNSIYDAVMCAIQANSLTLQNCGIATPSGAHFDATQKTIIKDSEVVRTPVEIGNCTKYGLVIMGDTVTSFNYKDILGDGHVTYNPTSKVLDISNTDINWTGASNVIEVLENNMTINFTNANIYSTHADSRPIFCKADTLTLVAWCDSGATTVNLHGGVHGIRFSDNNPRAVLYLKSNSTNGNKDFSQAYFDIYGNTCGIVLKVGEIQIDNVGLKLSMSSEGSHLTAGIAKFQMHNAMAVTPAVITMSSTSGSPTYNGTEWKQPLEIRAYLTFSIMGVANNSAYGTVTGSGVYPLGTSVTLTATPNNGYQFLAWMFDGTPISADNPYVFTPNNDMTIEAYFTKDTSTGLMDIQGTEDVKKVILNGQLYIIRGGEIYDAMGNKM